MKWWNILFGFIFLACTGERLEDLQRVDQVLHIYFRNEAGEDLLKQDHPEVLLGLKFRDLEAEQHGGSLMINIRQDREGAFYVEYVAGAVRRLEQDAGGDVKKYRSSIAVQYTSPTNPEVNEDIMEVYYISTPMLFQVNAVVYNGKRVFSNTQGEENTVTIVK